MNSREYSYEGAAPAVDPTASVSLDATLAGQVTVAEDVTVWPGAVLRGDVAPVDLGAGSAIGDNAVLHGSTVGEGGMIGHGAVVNDTTVERGAMVGFNATVSDTTVGAESIVAMGSVVPSGYEVPPASFVRGTPASVSPLAETDIDRDAVYEQFGTGEFAHLTEGHAGLFD